MSNELKSLQCLVRSEEQISTGNRITRATIETLLVGFGPPISFFNSSFTSSVIFMNKLVPRGINSRLACPYDFDLPNGENIEFNSKSGNKLKGWKVDALQPVIGSVLYVHGSGGNRGWPFYRVKLMKILSLCGFNVFSFDFSGFGDSEGTPSQSALNLDIISAFEKMKLFWPNEKNIIWAHSLGTGLVAHLIANNNNSMGLHPDGIIFESPIESLRNCMEQNPLGQKLRKLWGSFLFNKMIDYHIKRTDLVLDTDQDMIKLPHHILILQAEDDPIVSWQNSRRHFSRLSSEGSCASARFILFESWHKYRHEGIPLFPGLKHILDEFVQVINSSRNASAKLETPSQNLTEPDSLQQRFQADVM